ncbi:HPr kinase/phosphorylase [candidate division KSB1 bacterium]|nr:HPr kinase/phosphorylase [candidate division KSB1 bacterium]
MPEKKEIPFITVAELYEQNHQRIGLKVINNQSSFMRKIREREIHRPGLALSGFVDVFTYWRIQIIGNTEIGYLNTLPPEQRTKSIRTVLGFEIPCIILTNKNEPPKELVEIADQNGITLFSTPLNTTTVIHQLSDYLDGVFAPETILHGSMVDVYGVGVLITGESAIGKSELALDLIERGHQLVADDVVHITRVGRNQLQGEASEILQHHMEIRGLGIIDVRRMFGIRAIRGKKNIHIVIHLERYSPDREYERIGVDESSMEILGVKVPHVVLPIMSGKNITVIVEVVAMNHKLKELGENAAQEFNERLISGMMEQKQ